jgi:hypothetical protein
MNVQGLGAPARMLTYYSAITSTSEVHSTVYAANSGPYTCVMPQNVDACKTSTVNSVSTKLGVQVKDVTH